MKKKRFIKLMRAAGLPPHIIRQAVDAVKSCGGRHSYEQLLLTIMWRRKFGLSCEKHIEFIKMLYSSPRIKKLSQRRKNHKIRRTIEINEYFIPPFALDEEKEETPKPWAKENPFYRMNESED